MENEISDLQRKRANNLIWNAAGNYSFRPDYRFYTENGHADVYWNTLIGLAARYYDYEQLRPVFWSLETEEDADIYESLLWMGLENALVLQEEAARPVLHRLQQDYAAQYLARWGSDYIEDDRFWEFLSCAHYRRILGMEQKVSRYDIALLDELEFPAGLSTEELVQRMRALLQKWFAIRTKERAREHRPLTLPFFHRQEERRRKKTRFRCFGPGFAEHPYVTDGGNELPPDPLSRKSTLSEAELRAFMEEKYGRSIYREDQTAALEKQLCQGNHRNCHLHVTRGETGAVHIRNGFEALQKEREAAQIARNRAVWYEHEAENRIAISRLTEKIQNSVLLYLQPDDVRANAGLLDAGRVWRASALNDSAIFRRRENSNAGDVSVDILLDASTSQKGRLESISGQAYCIAEALTRCHIPCRLLSFCSMTGYTVLRIYRDYYEPEKNTRIFDYVANGCNRDGLAIRTVRHLMGNTPCEHRLLIILSDVKPQDVVRVFQDEDGDYIPYEAETAVQDTAYEVRRARAEGIAVICVFTGEDGELPAAKTLYGRDFTHLRAVEQLADTVGMLIQNQIRNL